MRWLCCSLYRVQSHDPDSPWLNLMSAAADLSIHFRQFLFTDLCLLSGMAKSCRLLFKGFSKRRKQWMQDLGESPRCSSRCSGSCISCPVLLSIWSICIFRRTYFFPFLSIIQKLNYTIQPKYTVSVHGADPCSPTLSQWYWNIFSTGGTKRLSELFQNSLLPDSLLLLLWSTYGTVLFHD